MARGAGLPVPELVFIELDPGLARTGPDPEIQSLPSLMGEPPRAQPRPLEWLVAPRSTIIQTSPVHTGRCTEPDATIEQLLDSMVRAPR
jgi:hypothetical protein